MNKIYPETLLKYSGYIANKSKDATIKYKVIFNLSNFKHSKTFHNYDQAL